VKGVALNQTRSPERIEWWSIADPIDIGAGETWQSVMASNAVNSRGLRLHRAERTEYGTTRRVAGKVLRKDIYSKDGRAKYGEPT
jgi:hypothetical protein